jgi:adenine specific DNA methylase Mod
MERSFLKFFKGKSVEDLKDMKWCDLIAEDLIECIIEYKKSKVRNKRLHGCAAILMVSDVLSSEWL